MLQPYGGEKIMRRLTLMEMICVGLLCLFAIGTARAADAPAAADQPTSRPCS
jgi:hypothetical protein